jgi:hypothetical protein
MKLKTFLVILFVSVLFSCRKEPNTEDLKLDQVVATDRDLTANFSGYATYFISDTVSIVASASTDSILTGPMALQLVNAVKTNMNAKGYTFKARSAGLPDLGLRLTVIKDITRTAVCGGWWDGWYGYYPPWYWGCYYCGGYYYPWCTTYTYTIGTSTLYMFDVKNQGINHDLRALWGATMFGVFSTTNNQTNADLTTTAINQAYSQSTYLTK